MAFNGTGTFSLAAGNPVVTGTVISSTVHNNTMSDIANNGLSNCITKDGQTTITQNIPLNNKKITNLGAGTLPGDVARIDQIQNSSLVNLSSVSGTDTVTASISPVIAAYASGQIFVFEPANDNTGATTLNISSLGAKDIYFNGAALEGGELKAGEPVFVRYNGTQFDLFNLYKATIEATTTVAGSMTLLTAHRKNLIVNGNKKINQRGVATNTTTTDDYNFDRWFYDGTYLYQSVEASEISNDTFTVSWDSNATCEYRLISTGISSSGLSAVTTGWTSVADGASFTLSGVSGNNLWLRFFTGSDGLNALTNLQLEKGTVATDFEYRPEGYEKFLCERYFTKITVTDVGGILPFPARRQTATSIAVGMSLPTSMRTTPTLSAVGTGFVAQGNGQADTAITAAEISLLTLNGSLVSLAATVNFTPSTSHAYIFSLSESHSISLDAEL